MSYWQGKVAIVTGGSGGLGRSIAEALGVAGARVAIAARGAQELEQTASELRARGGEVLALPTDVTQPADVEAMVAQTVEHFGRLDMLVNNAGRSMRRAILETHPSDFQEMLELNLLAVVRCTLAAMPHLLAAKGHLVNISSLSGKTAARYLGAYPASKFAVTGYTQQLRLELAEQGLHVLLVCPGPIARKEPRPRTAEELAGLPASAGKPGGGVKTSAVEPQKLAAAILKACQGRKRELIYPPLARLLFAVMQLSPRLSDYIVRRMT